MKIARSTYYYETKKQDHEALIRQIEAIVLEFSGYGYRRVTKELKRRGTQVNHKVIRRLMRERGLSCKQKKSFVVHTTDSNHPYPIYPNRIKGLAVTRLNQVWIADITYVRVLKRICLSCRDSGCLVTESDRVRGFPNDQPGVDS